MTLRIGQGYDVHQLVPGRPLILGGVTIPFEKGLLGHSDADALLHAITDALLGAAALGDIGTHFPDSAAEHKDADSRALLRQTYAAVQAQGWRVVNVDSTIIAQQPKLRPHIDACAPTSLPTWGWLRTASISKAKLTKNSATSAAWKASKPKPWCCWKGLADKPRIPRIKTKN